jgi:hypothetical protein
LCGLRGPHYPLLVIVVICVPDPAKWVAVGFAQVVTVVLVVLGWVLATAVSYRIRHSDGSDRSVGDDPAVRVLPPVQVNHWVMTSAYQKNSAVDKLVGQGFVFARQLGAR